MSALPLPLLVLNNPTHHPYNAVNIYTADHNASKQLRLFCVSALSYMAYELIQAVIKLILTYVRPPFLVSWGVATESNNYSL